MDKDGNTQKEIDLKNYDDGGVSLREMNIGLWLSERRQTLLKLLTAFLILISAFFFIFSTYQYIRYFLAGDPNDDFTTDSFVSSPRKLTDDFIISPLSIFSAGDKFDLTIELSNPNSNFLATFDYCFYQDGSQLSCGQSFILPSESQQIMALGTNLNQTSGLSFSIEEIFWRRIDTRKINDWGQFSSDHLNFPISELEFSSADKSGLSEKVDLNSLHFSVTNSTPYGYYEVPLDILFYSGERLVGVNRYVLNNFLPGHKRSVNLSWSAPLASVTRTEIRPRLNIMDDVVYIPYSGN